MLALVGVVLGAVAGSAQISPGPLSKPHSSLSGATSCTSCHRLGGQATFKCLECHTEIAGRLANGHGYHAHVVAKDAGSKACVRCHSEHNGDQFAIVKWDPSQQQFDHSQTGWPLIGKHAGLLCSRCHNPANIAAGEKSQIKVKDLSRTFLGATRDCIGCHKDPHQGQLGRTCEQCHNSGDWKTVPNFDHSRTRYALTGAHVRVNCQKCHTPAQPGGPPRWTGLVFDRCNGCHTDPHRGAFAASCQSCHNSEKWKAVGASALAAKFDHGRTKYPLQGKHAEVRCDQCHVQGDFKKPIAFQKCSDCHRPDPHSGQFVKRADAGECSACHTVAGFKPAKFGVPEHSKTAYPLQGKHAKVACERCHIPAGKATRYRISFAHCTDCHRDAHERQFAAAPILNRCETCHTVQEFRPALFTLAQHQKSRFPLYSGHLAVPCNECHKPMAVPGLEKAARYRFDDRSCTACHRDPHRGQFAQRMRAAAHGKPAGCEVCHALVSWKELSRFDHASTAFILTGSHRAVACADCHRPPNLETDLANVNFSIAPKSCEECHVNPHGGQFVQAGAPEKCASCHNTNKWKPSLFDHNARTRFPLEGVHKNVRCARCHATTRLVADKQVLFYKPTPTACAACHGANVGPNLGPNLSPTSTPPARP